MPRAYREHREEPEDDAVGSGRPDTRQPSRTKSRSVTKAASQKRPKAQAPAARKRRKSALSDTAGAEDLAEGPKAAGAPAASGDVEEPAAVAEMQPSGSGSAAKQIVTKRAKRDSEGVATAKIESDSEGAQGRSQRRLRESRAKPSSPWWMVQSTAMNRKTA